LSLTKIIQKAIGSRFVLAGVNAVVENMSGDLHEMDVASVNDKGFITEVEVKISRSDFKADMKKNSKWKYFTSCDPRICPNYFYYACPDGLIKKEELPDWAGLFYFYPDEKDPNGPGKVVKVKTAQLRHKTPVDPKILKKMLRMYTQRHFIGGCALTVKNRAIRQANLQRGDSKLYEDNNDAICDVCKKPGRDHEYPHYNCDIAEF
jgi:hypothetical protein